MANYSVRLLRTAPECNPEFALVDVEAADEDEAKKKAAALGHRPSAEVSWTSYGDPKLWGKSARISATDATVKDDAPAGDL